ncbi:MAG: DUF4344 domain-containing metallopeptidase [Pseudomonadota bacterium]
MTTSSPMRTMIRPFAIMAALAAPAVADEAQEHFVAANIISIFYHELGHAVIDVEGLPIYGQEEDAADVFSIFMIDALFEQDAAEALAYDAAWGFLAEAEARDAAAEDIAWWGVHAPDEQRFYNTACLFFGADPGARSEFADFVELPEDRRETCAEEYDQANHAWGAVLDRMAARGPADTLMMADNDGSLTALLVAEEAAALNAQFQLARPVTITIESCGEANAFYDPDTSEIVMCAEFEDYLRELANLLE